MPVQAKDISWGKYKNCEGPMYLGKQRYVLPSNPTLNDQIIAVITATEGGTYDAYNGYDTCICTVGLIQLCDRAPWFQATNLFGALANISLDLIRPLTEYLSPRGYEFRKFGASIGWRFYSTKEMHEVGGVEAQRKLYLGGVAGTIGSWTPEARELAKGWAAAVANVWDNWTAKQVQLSYVSNRLRQYAFGESVQWIKQAEKIGDKYALAFLAGYLSFAANNPAAANNSLVAALKDQLDPWSEAWLVNVLKHLTFDPKIAIYPVRYNKIRGVLEKLYGIDLPDFAEELKTWKVETGYGGLLDVHHLQQALLWLGFDLGPAGVDGVLGKHTKAALLSFEKSVGLPANYCDGTPDQHTIPALESALGVKGKELGWY